MPRERITTLFSRNGISITKTALQNTKGEPVYGMSTPVSIESRKDYEARMNGSGLFKAKNVLVKKQKQSPLGFYYVYEHYDTVYEIESPTGDNTSDKRNVAYDEVKVMVGHIQYTIKYPYMATKGTTLTKISEDIRPWELTGGTMPSHFVKDLYEVCEKIFSEDVPAKYRSKCGGWASKSLLYRSLFGNADGLPMMYTDEMKIVSHGFDPKMSFRKEKESKK